MITSNTSQVIKIRLAQLQGLQADQVARACALSVLPEMRNRIHVDGKDSNDAQIGTYTNEYMKLRTGVYPNSGKFVKGASKGLPKNAGTYTKGKDKGSARFPYNRTNDKTVVLSLTRQMENDMNVLASGKSYGIGYLNPLNYNKSQWCEATYKKKIFSLTQSEKDLTKKVAQEFVDQLLKQQN